jgi:tRNA-splicing ligase RtcB
MSNRSEEVNRIIEKLKKEGREKEIQDAVKHIPIKVVDKELAYLKDKNMSNYIHDMKIAQMYASSNRNLIAKTIISKMNFEYIDSFETIHNYIDTDRMILRKGAVDAQSSRNILIPMNMRDGCLVCRGKGNKDWNYSAPHGAGRLMSRSKAKENINIDEFTFAPTVVIKILFTTASIGAKISDLPKVTVLSANS